MAAVVLGGTALPSTANASSYAYGAFTPTANDLLVMVANYTGFTGTTSTCTDSVGGFTYSKVLEFAKNNGDIVCVFVANALATAVSHTITVNTGGAAATGCDLTCLRVSGMTKTGSTAVKQSQSGSAGAITPAVTLGAAPLTTNPLIGGVGNQTNPATMTPPASWTERSDIGHTTTNGGQEVASIDSGFTSTTVTWGSASATSHGVFVIELDASSGAVTSFVFSRRNRNRIIR